MIEQRAPAEVARPVQRSGADVARAGLAILLLALVGSAARRGVPTAFDIRVLRLLIESPNASLIRALPLGTLLAVIGLCCAAAWAGRRRLALVLLTAGTAAWGARTMVRWLVPERRSTLHLHPFLLGGGANSSPVLSFPCVQIAVAAALAVAGSPYLGRRGRRTCWMVVGCLAVTLMYIGPHLPVDIIGGLTLGVAVGAIVNLALGVPTRGPHSSAQLGRLLDSAGVSVVHVEHADGPGLWRCRSADGHDYLVKSVSCDRPGRGWLSVLWRFAAYREMSLATRAPTRRAEHEARLSLLAEGSGVRIPALVAARDSSDHTGMVVRRWIDATPLSEVPADSLTDAVLVDAWRQLACVHRAGIVHPEIDPGHVLVDPLGQVWLVGWGGAQIGAGRASRDTDLAGMAVTLASRAGPSRAIRTGDEALGSAPVSAMLGRLHTHVLGPVAHDLAAKDPHLLPDLRREVAALDGSEPPPFRSPARLAVKNLLPLVGLALAVYLLLPRLARSSTSLSTLRHAQWPWLLGVAAGSALTYVMATVSFIAAAGRRLPIRRTFAVQLAAASTNRVVPAGLGAAATNMRYLEKEGLDRPGAVAAVGLTTLAGFIVHVIATIAAVLLLRSRASALHVPDLDATWPALLMLGAAGAVVGWLGWARGLHAPVLRWLRATRTGVGAVVGHPGRLALLITGSVGISVAYILALTAALAAYGAQPGLGTVAGVYLASSAVASVAPTPGGIGPFEAAAVAGFGTLGVGAGPAVAAVITYRLITYWIPVVPGAIALYVLRRGNVL